MSAGHLRVTFEQSYEHLALSLGHTPGTDIENASPLLAAQAELSQETVRVLNAGKSALVSRFKDELLELTTIPKEEIAAAGDFDWPDTLGPIARNSIFAVVNAAMFSTLETPNLDLLISTQELGEQGYYDRNIESTGQYMGPNYFATEIRDFENRPEHRAMIGMAATAFVECEYIREPRQIMWARNVFRIASQA